MRTTISNLSSVDDSDRSKEQPAARSMEVVISMWTKSPSGTGLPLVVLNGFLLQTCVLCLRRCSAVQVLLKAGADIQAKEKYGETSLQIKSLPARAPCGGGSPLEAYQSVYGVSTQ